jgi:hypothetical protein
MALAGIRETVVEEIGSNCVVRLFLSDQPRESQEASIRIDILAVMSRYRSPLLVQLQRRAIADVIEVLQEVDKELLQEIPRDVPAEPKRIGQG